MTFGEAALRHFAIAAQGLGWAPDIFWEATPAELAAALRPVGEGEMLDGGDVAALRAMIDAKKDEHGGRT